MQDFISNNSRPVATEACNSAGEGYSASAQPDIRRGYLFNGVVGDSQTAPAAHAQQGKGTLHGRSARSKPPTLTSTVDVPSQLLGRTNSESYVGHATKLTAATGTPGQITLVRSPNNGKIVHKDSLQQQSQPHQHQLGMAAEHEQQSTKGLRSHRVRKTKVPAVPSVIADVLETAREVQNAVDMSNNQESDVSHRAKTHGTAADCIFCLALV